MHASDRDLIKFLSESSSENNAYIIKMMDTFWSFDMDDLEIYGDPSQIDNISSNEKYKLAEKTVKQLGYFGSDSLAYMARSVFDDDAGIPYKEILQDVAELLNKQLERKNRRDILTVGSVDDYERFICETLLHIQFEGKSSKDIEDMLADSGLDRKAAKEAAKEFAAFGMSGGSIIGLVKILGKRVVKDVIQRVIIWIVAKTIGREAAEAIAMKAVGKFAQFRVAAFISGVGWALLAWDGIRLGKQATRITTPCVSYISAVRTMDRIDNEKSKKSIPDAIREITNLLKEGILSKDEYDRKKAELLKKL